MGFYLMVISMLLGVFGIVLGVSHRTGNSWYKISIVLGVVLVFFTVYLGFPK